MPGTAVRYANDTRKTLVTSLDAAHLTNLSTRGIMLASVVKTADGDILLKTLSVCSGTETSDSWDFHLSTERRFLGLRSHTETFISDRKSGLATVINTIQPHVKIAACTKHLADNLKTSKHKFSEEAMEIF